MVDNIIAEIGKFYSPFDAVNIVNENINVPLLKLILNWVLFVTSLVFLLVGVLAILNFKTNAKIGIKLYIVSLIIMFAVDCIASYFETRHLLKRVKSESVDFRSVISISISVVVGVVTYLLLKEQICHHRAGKKFAQISFMLLLLKLLVALTVVLFAGGTLYQNYFVAPNKNK